MPAGAVVITSAGSIVVLDGLLALLFTATVLETTLAGGEGPHEAFCRAENTGLFEDYRDKGEACWRWLFYSPDVDVPYTMNAAWVASSAR